MNAPISSADTMIPNTAASSHVALDESPRVPIPLAQPGTQAEHWFDLLPPRRLDAPANLARHATAHANHEEPGFPAANVIDGVIANASAWISKSKEPRLLTLTWTDVQDIGCIVVIVGREDHGCFVANPGSIRVEQRTHAGDWVAIPGAVRERNEQVGVRFELAAILRTRALCFIFTGHESSVMEVMAYAGPATKAPRTGLEPPVTPLVLLNQVGFDPRDPKRFTAPLAPDGAAFEVRPLAGGPGLFKGVVRGGLGDFSAIGNTTQGVDYVVEVSGCGLSDTFKIEPFLLERCALAPALHFWIDDRSVVGNHTTAACGGAWRDGPYYNYDVPGLVWLYLSNPSYFDQFPVEIDHAADKRRALDPELKLVNDFAADGALEAVRRYYERYTPPFDRSTPDIIQLIHWGVGYVLEHPWCDDAAGDPLCGIVHPQTIEKLAFFLYAYPQIGDRIDRRFYDLTLRFVLDHWNTSRCLFNVFKGVGNFKGRECPGHSVLPNLMMHAVARREGLAIADRFLDAAVRQVEWIVNELDVKDPRVTKGQRMSEHMLITGLWSLLKLHPDRAPAGLRAKIDEWSDTMIARSKNLWDFRKYNDDYWTLPRYELETGAAADESHGGTGWNEPGNVAGFTGVALAAADVVDDSRRAARLRELAASHMDNVFGRNPLGAHFAYRGPLDFPGVKRGFPTKFKDFTCARLDYVRGALSSSAAHEHYPYNPLGGYRHNEGWSAFNAAFNVGLAFLCREHTQLTARFDSTEIQVTLEAPVFGPHADVHVTFSDGRSEKRTLAATSSAQTQFCGRLPAPANGTITLGYGFGLLAKTVTLTR